MARARRAGWTLGIDRGPAQNSFESCDDDRWAPCQALSHKLSQTGRTSMSDLGTRSRKGMRDGISSLKECSERTWEQELGDW